MGGYWQYPPKCGIINMNKLINRHPGVALFVLFAVVMCGESIVELLIGVLGL